MKNVTYKSMFHSYDNLKLTFTSTGLCGNGRTFFLLLSVPRPPVLKGKHLCHITKKLLC